MKSLFDPHADAVVVVVDDVDVDADAILRQCFIGLNQDSGNTAGHFIPKNTHLRILEIFLSD